MPRNKSINIDAIPVILVHNGERISIEQAREVIKHRKPTVITETMFPSLFGRSDVGIA